MIKKNQENTVDDTVKIKVIAGNVLHKGTVYSKGTKLTVSPESADSLVKSGYAEKLAAVDTVPEKDAKEKSAGPDTSAPETK